MSNVEDRSGRIHSYIEEILIQLHQSQRNLIQARYAGEEESWQLRAELQSDIISSYWILKTYQDRVSSQWKSITLYRQNGEEVTGLDHIMEWDQLQETVQEKRGDLTSEVETHTQPKVLPRNVLIQAGTAITRVADKIGFNAHPDNSLPTWGFDEVDEVPDDTEVI